MLKLPETLNRQFDNFLLSNSFSDKDRAFYKKWLRFYWGFCHKYRHDVFHSGSLPLFLQKLQAKNQSVQQQNQAKQAISLFLEMHTASEQQMAMDKSASIASRRQNVNYISTVPERSKHVNDHPSVVKETARQNYSNQSRPDSLRVNHLSDDTGASWVFMFD